MAKPKPTPEELRERKAAYMREWLKTPAGLAYVARSKEQHAAAWKARHDADPDELRRKQREYNTAYYATGNGRRRKLAQHEKWRKENPESFAASRAKYYATEKGRLYKWSNSASQRCRKVEAYRQDGRVRIAPGGTITAQDLRDLWASQAGVCVLTGRPMVMHNGSGKSVLDSPSVDRIESDGIYEIGNVRLITMQANSAKLFGTDEDLYAFCEAVLAHRDRMKR